MGGHRREVTGVRYSNCNNHTAAIVAVANYHNDTLYNWALYWGGAPCYLVERAAYEHVAEHGDKMSYEDAKHFCPDLPIERYRG